MKHFKETIRLGIILAMSIAMTVTSFAHSGRTDSNGGHRDNKNKSGLGSYHYHCGGYPAHLHSNGVCPYSSGYVAPSSSSSSTSTSSSASKAQAAVPTYTVKEQNFDLNGEIVAINTIVKNGVSLVELKTFANGLGISLEYDKAASAVIARYNNGYVSLLLNSKSAKANGVKTELTVAPTVQDGRTYVPARYIAESFGMTVNYDAVAGITSIIKK
nr:copper amine oxidase N-terminal domain-containing protein [uncultured Cellulosilyticum sp.]